MNQQKLEVVACKFVDLCKAYGLSNDEMGSLGLGVAIGVASTTGELDRVAERLAVLVRMLATGSALVERAAEALKPPPPPPPPEPEAEFRDQLAALEQHAISPDTEPPPPAEEE